MYEDNEPETSEQLVTYYDLEVLQPPDQVLTITSRPIWK